LKKVTVTCLTRQMSTEPKRKSWKLPNTSSIKTGNKYLKERPNFV
jgi:hypothetical protein